MNDYMKDFTESARDYFNYQDSGEWRRRGNPSNPNVKRGEINMVSIPGLKGWSAPRGWNEYLTTGNFIGCRPIIKHGTRINSRTFESINFEMV